MISRDLSDPEIAQRGSKELWLGAAREALIDGGPGAVKIQPLGQKLGLARTSFYCFFKNAAELTTELFQLWTETNTQQLIIAADAYAATASEAVLNVISVFFDETAFDPRFELAIRGWAQSSMQANADVAQADELRLQALERMFVRHGFSRDEAEVRAQTIYYIQIGYISVRKEEELVTRIRRVPAYVHLYTGKHPTDEEMQRFGARHPV